MGAPWSVVMMDGHAAPREWLTARELASRVYPQATGHDLLCKTKAVSRYLANGARGGRLVRRLREIHGLLLWQYALPCGQIEAELAVEAAAADPTRAVQQELQAAWFGPCRAT